MATSDSGHRSTVSYSHSSTNPVKKTKARSLAKTFGRLDPTQLRHNGRSSANKINGSADSGRYDARYKVVMLGESGVGKTSMIRAAIGEPFSPTMISTIGIDFVMKTYTVDHYQIQLQIWDTAGQERYRSLAASTFRDAKAFVIVYDVTSRDSFQKIREEWLKMTDNTLGIGMLVQSLDEENSLLFENLVLVSVCVTDFDTVATQGSEPVPIFFAGNKADLIRLKEVPTEEAQRLSQQQYAHGFFETSALTGQNVQNLFQSVATAMVSTWSIPQLFYQATPTFQNNNPFQLSDQAPQGHNIKSLPKRKKKVTQCCAT